VTPRQAWQAVLVGLVVVFGCGAVLITPVDRSDYHDTLVNSAAGALSAVRVVDQVCRAQAERKTFRPYVRTMLADAREAVATSEHDLARLDVPDRESARLRDELTALLRQASAAIGDAGIALGQSDPAAIGQVRNDLQQVADALVKFVEDNP
jgi:hypothetical protein